jgi:phosphatidylglycerophosphate synthase
MHHGGTREPLGWRRLGSDWQRRDVARSLVRGLRPYERGPRARLPPSQRLGTTHLTFWRRLLACDSPAGPRGRHPIVTVPWFPTEVAIVSTPSSYRVDDQELLLDFYKKLVWDRLVPRIPARITPNSLTLTGLVCSLGAAVATVAAWKFAIPWLYLVSAFLLFAYLTLDNVDGAHARRTGQTSYLGEFLDHGLDGLASTFVLVITCIVLQMEGVLFASLCALAGIGFAFIFWEQFRTGLLVIPRVSSTEGVTLLMVVQTTIAIAGEPAWMRFSLTEITPGTVIIAAVLLGYLVASFPPVIRASRAGASGWELIPVALLIGVQPVWTLLGASPFYPGITAGLIGGAMTCGLIVLRHRGASGPILPRGAWLTPLPFLPAIAAPGLWTVEGWAALSLAFIALDYLRLLFFGGAELNRRGRERKAQAEKAGHG